jgi:ribosomal protein S8
MTEDFIKAFEQLNKLPIQRNSSTIDFELDYIKSKEEIFKECEKVKYLEMWKKVKREFTFVNKI